MVKLNVYTITYIEYNKEKKIDVIASDPSRACEDVQRAIGGTYRDIEIVELTQISKEAIYYQTPKRKKK